MVQDRDQYVQFTIKLLKGSFALNALWQDALNYHMIDQPEKLIALRLTEYYEMVARGASRPMPAVPAIPPSPAPAPAVVSVSPDQQPTAAIKMPRLQRPQAVENRPVERNSDIVTSADTQVVEQNADEAADYWTPL